MARCFLLPGLASVVLAGVAPSVCAQSRVLGIDVSAWQGELSPTTWTNLRNDNDRDFVFIRSSRGGTTGFYNQSDPQNNNGQNTLSQRYDDPYFTQNITRATEAGLYAGPYHFARPDIISTTQNSGGIANTGTDEANHFIEMAGPWMRPGYLVPAFDLEAGQNERSSNQLAQFSIDFGERIYEVMGIRPAIYINNNYASILQGASSSLEDAVVAAFPTLWSARWPNQSNPDAIPVQTGHPKDTFSTVYGPWDDPPNPTHPWSFWQYASTARLSGYNNGLSNIDVNVAQGGTEFLKDHLVPAVWMNDNDGQWTTLANWNSGQTPIAPVQGPGQVRRVERRLSLPDERLPGPDDTVILDRPNATIEVTLASGVHNIRKLEVREPLVMTGGDLTINYVPSPDSTPTSARFSAPVTMTGGHLSVHTLQVDAAQDFALGGELTFDTINLVPHGTAPAEIMVVDDISLSPLDNTTAAIVSASTPSFQGRIDLGGENYNWQVGDGDAATDVSINVPLVNGSFVKGGPGVLALGASTLYTGDVTVEGGKLVVSNFLADTADVSLSTGAGLELNYSGAPDIVNSFFVDGVSQPAGVWGPEGSGAEFTSPLILGSGQLQVLTFVPSLPGDYNDDGVVDAADYAVWRDSLGAPAGTLPNDVDGGTIGANHYATWKANFGNVLSSSLPATGAAIPEPASLLLILLAGSILALWQRRPKCCD